MTEKMFTGTLIKNVMKLKLIRLHFCIFFCLHMVRNRVSQDEAHVNFGLNIIKCEKQSLDFLLNDV